MVIEIKDLNLVSEVQDLQNKSIDTSTALEIRGGFNPYGASNYWEEVRVSAATLNPKPIPSRPGSFFFELR